MLFSPSPQSFYRVRQFPDVGSAWRWCEAVAATPLQSYLRLIACQAVEARDFMTIARFRIDKSCRYLVLWKDMEPCYHSIREFDQLRDAKNFTLATKTRLQKLQKTPGQSHHGLPHTLRLLAVTTFTEWNVPNKPKD